MREHKLTQVESFNVIVFLTFFNQIKREETRNKENRNKHIDKYCLLICNSERTSLRKNAFRIRKKSVILRDY